MLTMRRSKATPDARRYIAKGNSMSQPADWKFDTRGSGPPVIFLHGLGATTALWEGMVALLCDRFTCVTISLPGHAGAPAAPMDLSIDDLMQGIEKVRARIGVSRIHLVGHAFGGMIASAYARHHPENVGALALVANVAFRTEEVHRLIARLRAELLRDGVGAFMGALPEVWFSDSFIAAQPDAVARAGEQAKLVEAESFRVQFWLFTGTEMGDWLPEVTCPTLVMAAELDSRCPADVNRKIAATLPRAELVILDRLKHLMAVEAPERLAAALAAHLLAHPL